MTLEQKVISIFCADPERRAVINTVARLELPDLWVAGGYVRNPVWDDVFGSVNKTPGTDVDVVYFKPLDQYGMNMPELETRVRRNVMNPVWEEEDGAQNMLSREHPNLQFEVKNQARMYCSSVRAVEHVPYTSLGDALAGWTETATAVGIRFRNGAYEVFAPFGLHDLFNGVVRPTIREHTERAKERAEEKRWFEKWPHLRFEPTPIPRSA